MELLNKVKDNTDIKAFQNEILKGIPDELPPVQPFDASLNHAPKRKDILNKEEKKLAIRNALRYFNKKHHALLAKEFAQELKDHGRIYMYRFRPSYKIHARHLLEYPHKSIQ
ncbi:MAG TPA: urocanate hydratase, partial [Bacteroidia bacterium]|nr:urocanate hydratase [Bacteroidia bacterium]